MPSATALTVYVSRADFLEAERPVSPAAPGSRVLGDIALSRGAQLRLAVKDHRGEPVLGGLRRSTRVRAASGARQRMGDCTLRPENPGQELHEGEGELRWSGLVPGNYTVDVDTGRDHPVRPGARGVALVTVSRTTEVVVVDLRLADPATKGDGSASPASRAPTSSRRRTRCPSATPRVSPTRRPLSPRSAAIP